jgi:N-acyl-D-amino-acid deacylase
MIPRWAMRAEGEGRRAEGNGRPDFAATLRKVLDDDSLTAALKRDIEHEIYRRGGPMRVMIMEADNAEWVGKSVGELAAERGITPVDMAIALQLEGNPNRRGGVGTRGLSLSEYDIEPYAAQEWTMTATDGWVTLPEDGLTHPRVYGTFPRKIAYYAKERGVLSVEAAIRSSTSLPGEVMGLTDRGWLREGYKADVVVFDLETIKDNATIFEPHQYSDGIEFVLINGRFVVDSGEPTMAMPGKVLVRNEKTASSTGAGGK